YKLVFIFILIGYILHFLPVRTENYFKHKFTNTSLIFKAIVTIVLIYFIVQIKSSDVQPFIYFQF
ncbi:MAG: MBOAT family protein, partial [Prevotellaceae bacterium]|nr:MBOAT family protein [Prevotellaceae bacterium]